LFIYLVSLKTASLHNTKAFVIYTLHRTRAVGSYQIFLDTLRVPVLDSARKNHLPVEKTAWVRLCKVYITNDLWLRKYAVFNVLQITGQIDVFASHDWPQEISKYGDLNELYKARHTLQGQVNFELVFFKFIFAISRAKNRNQVANFCPKMA
jgi:hypothetical protein